MDRPVEGLYLTRNTHVQISAYILHSLSGHEAEPVARAASLMELPLLSLAKKSAPFLRSMSAIREFFCSTA